MTFPPPRLLWLLAPLCATLLAACGKSPEAASGGGKSGKGGKGGGAAAPVIVGQVQRKVVPVLIDAIGAVEPVRTTSVRSQVTGTLLKIAIREGQDVQEGDLLFEIDSRPFRNALQSARADLEKLKIQLETARAQVVRYESLSTGQMVSKEQFQKIQDEARALEAELHSSEARVATAQLQLDYCSIRAPISGRTGNLGVHEGDLVRANESGLPLVTINQLSPIYVTFGVPQQHLAALNFHRAQRSLRVQVVPPGTEETVQSGELSFIDNTVDATTGTIRLKGTFPNSQHRLWPGQFASVTVLLAEPEVTAVAASAIQTSQTGQHVYVVTADRLAELRPVVVERTFEGEAVIAKGLNPGETVVIDGQLRVVPGRAVDVRNAPATPGTSPPAPAAVTAPAQAGIAGKERKQT